VVLDPTAVGYRGKTGQHLLAVSFTGFDPQETSAASFAVLRNDRPVA